MKNCRRIVSFCLILAMLLTLLPAITLFPVVEANAASSQTVTVYFKDSDGWGNVYGYVWNGSGTQLMGSWPGTQLSKNSTTGLYELKVEYTPSSSDSFNFIFNNNNGSQTANLSLSYDQLISGNTYWVGGGSGSPAKYAPPSISGKTATFTYESSSASSVLLAGTMNGWSGVSMTKSGSTFTYSCQLEPGAYEYKFVVDGNWVSDPGNPQTTGSDGNSYFIMTGMQDTTVPATRGSASSLPAELTYTNAAGDSVLTPVTYTVPASVADYVTLSGTSVTVSSAYTADTLDLTAANSHGATCTVTLDLTGTAAAGTKVTVHFLNTLGWNVVCGYAWVTSSGGDSGLYTWPGVIANRDGSGYHTMELTRTFAAGEGLGLLFHNNEGGQTADLTISASQIASGNVEVWVQPSTTAGDDGKFPVTMATSESGIFRPHVFGDGTVTFNYNGSGSTVYLAGSFNDWSTSTTKLTKSNGIWSTTVNLDPGVYEYKYIVDGEWVADPGQSLMGGYDGNSVVVVPTGDEATDTGKITVKLHFYRESGDYDGWDVWYWGSETSGSATLQSVTYDKGLVATFTVDGYCNSSAGYVVRKSDWSDKEFYDRFIDLSDVVSGTVHFFLNSGSATGSRVLGPDAINGAKPVYANLDYNSGKIWVELSSLYSGAVSTAFSITGPDSTVTVAGVEVADGGYWLTLSRRLTIHELSGYQVAFNSASCSINTDGLFYSTGFRSDYNYTGDDLGATWSASSTTFKVWAPTAKHVQVLRYWGGNYGNNDWIETVDMTLGEKGVWSVTIPGDLNGTYYNYLVHFEGYTVEATDPYADSTGANGDRGMVLNMDATDPDGWENDISPNQGMNYTDAIIYEMHVREFTIDSSSGVRDDWKGKYLGLTQSGTNYNGYSTGLEHLKELGITHVQLMPVYDFNSVDEYHLTDWQQYAWGYDPKNFNTPEGGYSTNPYDGSVRVNEFKQMVQTFHRNGINVVMDVVYNHAFDGGNFCGNKIVPNYYSRFYGEGNWSNGSGVGNDMATEREMVRNFIVDSIMHWVEEYHIDGFRFDLLGLIDTTTANEIAATVHAKYPYVMFYGEGWAPGGTAVEYGYSLTTKDNAWMVSEFGQFNDNFRNDIAGNNGGSWGFATGDSGKADAIANYFRASNGWSSTPSQTINYVSCHDNYSLMDKIIISRNGAYWDEMVRMNNLSAAIYMMAQGVPFIYSGEELLREKKDGDGNRYDNAYGTDDYINKLCWSDLEYKTYAQMADDYYAGLIEFRKNHAALRCPGGSDAWNYTSYHKINDNCILFYVDGYPNYECSDGICIIFNGSGSTQWVDLNGKIPSGYWQATIHGTQAGNTALWGMDVTDSSGNVGVEPYSATVLVKGDLVHEESVYNYNMSLVSCKHTNHNTSGVCTSCGAAVSHSYTSVTTAATCTAAGKTVYTCTGCGGSYTETIAAPGHSYSDVVTAPTCTVDGYTTHTCSTCGHSYTDSTVAATGHSYVDGICGTCGAVDPDYAEPVTVPTLTLVAPSLNFEDEIYYNVYYKSSDMTDVVEMGLITFDGYLAEGTIDDALEVIPGYVASGTNFMSHTNGIPSMKLGDALYFRVYAKLSDGTYAYSTTAAYHAVAYAKDILANSTNEKMKALVVAMLNYGAAAQVHFDHNTDSLMNSFLTDEQKALVSEYSSDMVDSIVAADSSKTGNFKAVSGGYSALAPSVAFEGAFSINYYFTPAKTMDGQLKLYYWKMDDYNAADVLTAENATGVVVMEETSVAGQYLGAVPEIAAKQIDQTVYVCGVYESNGVTYNTGVIAYSLAAYCLDRIAKGTETMKAFAAETIVYGYYAKQYFA